MQPIIPARFKLTAAELTLIVARAAAMEIDRSRVYAAFAVRRQLD